MKVKNWITLFLSLGTKCEGHHKKNVTPYMHALICHVPEQIEKYGNIKMFSGQGEFWICRLYHFSIDYKKIIGVEKNNDDLKRHYYSSNRHDAPANMLLTEAIIDNMRYGTPTLPSCARQKRSYVKHNEEYWTEGIFQSRKMQTNSNL